MTYASTVLADNPIAYWKLGEAAGATSIADSSTSGPRSSSAFHTPTMGAAAILAGDAGTSMSVAPDAGWTFPGSSQFNFGTGDFSVEAWVKPASVPSSLQVLFGVGTACYFAVSSGGTLNLNGGATAAASTTTVSAGVVSHIVVTRISGVARFYINGVLSNSVAQTDSMGDATSAPSIGFYYQAAQGGGNGYGFNGNVEHMAIYNAGLSQARVTAHYNTGSGSGSTSLVASQNLGDCIAASPSTATVTATASGGQAAITYAWYQSPTINFTPGSGNLVAGQTAATATFTVTPGTDSWVACVISDGTTTVTTFHRLLSISGLAPLRVGYIGDSTTNANVVQFTLNSPGTYAQATGCLVRWAQDYLATRQGNRKVTAVNTAVSGTSSGDWVSGSANLNAALAAFTAAGMVSGDFVVIRLGVNDAQGHVAESTYVSNMASLIGALTAAGYKVQLDYPTWREPGAFGENTSLTFDESTTSYLYAYYGDLAAKVNGSTIFAGDKVSARNTASQPTAYLNRSTQYPGGIHPQLDGAMAMGINSAEALLINLGLVGAGGTYPTAAQVVNGVTFGPTANLTGNVVLPTAGQVQSGVAFGSAGSLTGTYLSGGSTQPSTTRTITQVVTNLLGVPLANTTFHAAFFDQVTPQTLLAPVDQIASITTSGTGVLNWSPHSALSSGGTGTLILSTTDGTTTQSPAALAFSGPVTVQ